MIGERLAHFRILEQLGAGGMGVVYRARDELLGRDVAIKVLPASNFRDPTARARLLREARTASQLNHPNICTIHEVGEADFQDYIAMELVEGRTLGARLAGGALPVDEVLRFGTQLSDALAHAHQRGVIHRDLKCANVIITPDERVKVLDFGLAKRMSEETAAAVTTQTEASLTVPGAVVGTLAYMAPEQLLGQPAGVHSDIWALGVILYEMAAGVRPFGGRTGFEITSGILNRPPPPLPQGPQGSVPAGLEKVIRRCLKKDPGERYQSADRLRAALAALHSPTASAASPPRPQGVRSIKRAAPRRRIRSLAVLPFANLSRDPGQEYFVDGMTETLITYLAKIRALKVISRTSIMRLKDSTKPLPEIAADLHVDAVIEGSVLRAGQRVRISAQLIHAATDTHLWAESYERDLQDVLRLQSEVARTIAEEISASVTPEEKTGLARAPVVNPEAYEACLQGRFHWYKLSPEHLGTALEYFRFALEKDANYAPAHAGIATVWMSLADTGSVPQSDAFAKARAAAAKAIELDDTLAEAHVTSANIRFMEWDWDGAEAEFRRALRIDPNNAAAHFFLSDFLVSLKRLREWKPEIECALESDPLNFFYQCFYGWHLVYLSRCDEAIIQLSKTLRMEPGFSSAHLGLWGAFFRKQNYVEAQAEARKFFAVLHDDEIVEALDRGYARKGYQRAMRNAAEVLAARSRQSHVPAFRVARVYAHAGEVHHALAWLEKACEQRETPMIHISVGWDWDDLRPEPRFQALLRKMNLPE